ncbi:hypothetical protein GH714_024177 [Hevea brasiliensis]|uniref:Uncharacterized protein n=1 Tax=Hevea brasiliensis TaxID=3981 RepID=A0A6A6LDC3_HEVBR|nr:hypothetical protein GH714_024177 [Hevea brasiliensis]
MELPPRVPHKAESCIKQNTSKPRKHTARFKGTDELREVAEEASKDPDGDIANTGPGAGSIRSGFGGLGLEGMVGSDDSAGEGTPAPVVGNTGSISGDKLGGEDKGASGNNAGAADMVTELT